jgi:hypothetical protein
MPRHLISDAHEGNTEKGKEYRQTERVSYSLSHTGQQKDLQAIQGPLKSTREKGQE